ncbi:MAG: hypothetical protein ISS70_23545 [Phycisphaerae bacterium]|nr:hypothetical protein [Phycisphaerae bacterium]
MNTIKRLSPVQAIINFPDFDIRIFVKYSGAGAYCSAIRIYKLPPQSSFLSMLRRKSLIWAIYGEDAIRLHGWFSKESNLLEALASKAVRCKDFGELKELLIDLERIMRGECPTGILMEWELSDDAT